MVGIGITTFNRNSMIADTVERIKKFSGEHRLVIVDDGSRVPVKGATFRFDINQGSAIAKNKCLELLDDCEHIFLFDDDTYPIKSGWEDLYISSGVKHLNYTFKYPFKMVNGLLHFENPNGCMMYIHRSVLDKVGGYDTGFEKYGYWHGAYSNRVFNAGLIPHPFMDVQGSAKYLYCRDQNPKENRTSTQNRGMYLAKNRRRYFEKIKSAEFIPYRNEIKIHYSNPYSTSKNIGRALNDFCAMVPDRDWICLQDGDILYLTPTWGKQIEEVIAKHGGEFGLLGCMTNRLARKTQRVGDMDDNHDIKKRHYPLAVKLEREHWGEVEDITEKKYIAGMFMLFPKSLWNKVRFRENTPAFDDYFSQEVRKKGYRLGLMKGLYVYHAYRIWSDKPEKDRVHLT